MEKLNVAELRLKLETLERRIRELEAEKKCDNKLKSDEIKEVRDEITEVLDDLDIANIPVQ